MVGEGEGEAVVLTVEGAEEDDEAMIKVTTVLGQFKGQSVNSFCT